MRHGKHWLVKKKIIAKAGMEEVFSLAHCCM